MRRRLVIPTVLVATLAVILAVVVGVVLARRSATPSGSSPMSPTVSQSVSQSASPLVSQSPSSSPAPGASPSRPAAPPSSVAPSPSVSRTAGPGVPRALAGKDVEVIPTDRRVVALTFDAGSDAAGLPAILRTLAATGTRATFFVTGRFAAAHPDSVRAIVAAGHRLGNHSATHPYFTTLSDAAIAGQLADGQRQILAAGGSDTRPLFRFPYGDRNARTIAAVNAAGYVAVRWTVDTLGWKGTSEGITVGTVVDRAVGAARPGEIVLMHVGAHPDDHSTLDADALPAIIDGLRARGYTFTTLDALLG